MGEARGVDGGVLIFALGGYCTLRRTYLLSSICRTPHTNPTMIAIAPLTPFPMPSPLHNNRQPILQLPLELCVQLQPLVHLGSFESGHDFEGFGGIHEHGSSSYLLRV